MYYITCLCSSFWRWEFYELYVALSSQSIYDLEVCVILARSALFSAEGREFHSWIKSQKLKHDVKRHLKKTGGNISLKSQIKRQWRTWLSNTPFGKFPDQIQFRRLDSSTQVTTSRSHFQWGSLGRVCRPGTLNLVFGGSVAGSHYNHRGSEHRGWPTWKVTPGCGVFLPSPRTMMESQVHSHHERHCPFLWTTGNRNWDYIGLVLYGFMVWSRDFKMGC